MNDNNEINLAYRVLIESDRVSPQTRAVLLQRMDVPDEPADEDAVTRDAVATLQKLAELVAPMTGRSIGFGALIHSRLAAGLGKGWRYSELPPDLAAYRAAIVTIDGYTRQKFGETFCALAPDKQIQTVTLIQNGQLEWSGPAYSEAAQGLAASQMQRWFEDLRGDVAALYMSHPVTLAELGYSGIADGAHSAALSGFVQLGLGQAEPWEPKARGTSR